MGGLVLRGLRDIGRQLDAQAQERRHLEEP